VLPVTDVQTVAWDLEPLVDGEGEAGVFARIDRAATIADDLAATWKGRIASLDAGDLATVMTAVAEVQDLLGRAGHYAQLKYVVDSADPALGALMQKVQERSTDVGITLQFVDLEWATVTDERAESLLADDRLAFCRYHLRSMLRYRAHLLSEAEERLDATKDITGRNAWVRLFDDLTSQIRCTLGDGNEVSLEQALSLLGSPDRTARQDAHRAVTEGLAPGLRTRAYIFNTLLADKSADDRVRSYPTWITSRNLANQATDASVEALVDAVRNRYDLPQRWYATKARVLGLDRLADYDRMASVASSDATIEWDDARALVLDAYRSFSPELASAAVRFFDEQWIDAPIRPAKRPGAFCAYTVPSFHPYVLLNWTDRQRDVLTLAHELGHGLHAYLARPQGVFHQSTPLTLAETASVFGETVTFNRLLAQTTDPAARFALLAEQVEGAIATVFRQTAMNRFETLVHTERREVGELSVERFGELWAESQSELFGDSMEVTDGYRTWWSYIPHFIGVPGYVYAYAYGQLLALSVYRRYQEQGDAFVPRYLDLLASGGSMAPEDLGRLVDCDLTDPAFWDGGLAIIAEQVDMAVDASTS
jgi:oligoendopeptidase F